MNQVKLKTNKKLNTGMAIIAYIIFFVPLITDDKDDPFVKFHVKQSLMLVVTYVGLMATAIIPIIGWAIAFFGGLGIFVLWIIGIINAANGEKKELPILGQYAEQIFKF